MIKTSQAEQIGKEIIKEGKRTGYYNYNTQEKWIFSDGSEKIMFVIRSHSCVVGKAWETQFFQESKAPEWVKEIFK